MSSFLDGKFVIVTSSTGYRDTIYVGYARREEDILVLERASMILRYEEVGVPGISNQPQHAVHLRPVTAEGGLVLIPFSSITAMVLADSKEWEEHLGVSR